jgi:hypothetical protein
MARPSGDVDSASRPFPAGELSPNTQGRGAVLNEVRADLCRLFIVAPYDP